MRIERRRRNERGSILAQVLVASVVAAVISAAVIRMALFRAKIAARNEYVIKEKRLDTSAVNTIATSWASVGYPCANNVPGYNCSPASAGLPGSCGCTCNPTTVTNPPQPVVTTAGSVTSCTLTIGTGNDLMPLQN